MMTCRWRPHHRAAVAPGDSRPHHPLITSNQGPPTMSYLLSLRRCTAAFAPLLALISALPADAHNPHPLGRQAIFWGLIYMTRHNGRIGEVEICGH